MVGEMQVHFWIETLNDSLGRSWVSDESGLLISCHITVAVAFFPLLTMLG